MIFGDLTEPRFTDSEKYFVDWKKSKTVYSRLKIFLDFFMVFIWYKLWFEKKILCEYFFYENFDF